MKKLIITILAIVIFSGVSSAEMVRTITQTSVTVTNASQKISDAVNTGRDITIQNNDSTGIVYINFSGTATAGATMFTLDPGDSISATNITNAIYAIGSIASNANVVLAEGN